MVNLSYGFNELTHSDTYPNVFIDSHNLYIFFDELSMTLIEIIDKGIV
jgi:hypothetical protein